MCTLPGNKDGGAKRRIPDRRGGSSWGNWKGTNRIRTGMPIAECWELPALSPIICCRLHDRGIPITAVEKRANVGRLVGFGWESVLLAGGNPITHLFRDEQAMSLAGQISKLFGPKIDPAGREISLQVP